MRKGRVSDCILTSSHLIPVASAHAMWRITGLVCLPSKSAFAPHCHILGSMSDMAMLRQESCLVIIAAWRFWLSTQGVRPLKLLGEDVPNYDFYCKV